MVKPRKANPEVVALYREVTPKAKPRVGAPGDVGRRPTRPKRNAPNVYLSNGQIGLIRRALRYYAHAEQCAIQLAMTDRNPAHAADVRRQCVPRIAAANDLCEALMRGTTVAPERKTK